MVYYFCFHTSNCLPLEEFLTQLRLGKTGVCRPPKFQTHLKLNGKNRHLPPLPKFQTHLKLKFNTQDVLGERCKKNKNITSVIFALTHTHTPVKTNIFPIFPKRTWKIKLLFGKKGRKTSQECETALTSQF